MVTLIDQRLTAPLQANQATYAGARSSQPVGIDFNVAAAAGKDVADGTAFLSPIMGNLLAPGAMTRTGNYLAGVIGAYSVPGVVSTRYGAAGVMGIIMDGAGKADAAFLAVIDGDSGQVTAGAAFGVMYNNSTAGSGFDYGVDLFRAAHDGYLPVAFNVAEMRLSTGAVVLSGSVDPAAGAGVAAPQGSIYLRTGGGTGAVIYQKFGAAATNWEPAST